MSIPLLLALCCLSVVFSASVVPVTFPPSDPRKPYWFDFQSLFLNRVDSIADPNWKSAGKFWYQASQGHMRADYYNYCEPHFNYSLSDRAFSCSYIFTPDTSFYRDSEHCCIFKYFGPIRPDVWQSFIYVGKDILRNQVVNVWKSGPEIPWDIRYYARYDNYEPVRFYGPNSYTGTGYLDFYDVDFTTKIPADVFAIDPSCNHTCPWPQ